MPTRRTLSLTGLALGILLSCTRPSVEPHPHTSESPVAPPASSDAPIANAPTAEDAGKSAEADCKKQDLCVRYGRCTPRAGACEWGGPNCKAPTGAEQWVPCFAEAKCTLANGVCTTSSRADCEASLGCQEDGRCSYENGACKLMAPTDCDIACKHSGRCRMTQADEMQKLAPAFEGIDGGPHCIAGSDADCRGSARCREYGLCKQYAVAGRCEASSAADCARSEACRRDGLCTIGYAFGFPDQRCVAKSQALCQKSQACKTDGRCHLVTSRPVVMMAVCAPKSDADCAASDECRREGFCHYEEESLSCVVKGAEDCRRSEACTRDGRCQFYEPSVPRPCIPGSD
jgi:hypothetical protein